MSRNTKYSTSLFLLIFKLLDESYSYTEALRKSNIEMHAELLGVKYKQFKMYVIEALYQRKIIIPIVKLIKNQ